MNKNEYMAMSLPYDLKIKSQYQIFTLHAYIDSVEVPSDYDHISIGNLINENDNEENVEKHHKPILRPLSDIINEIEHKGEKFIPIEFFEEGEEDNFEYTDKKVLGLLEFVSKSNCHHDLLWLPFAVVQKLIEWHFDIFGLIEKAEAIDYHTLPDFVF